MLYVQLTNNLFQTKNREGSDCGTCMALPGCVNGNCINPSNGQAEAFTCNCKSSWDGALCDIRKFMYKPVKLLDYDIWDSLFSSKMCK